MRTPWRARTISLMWAALRNITKQRGRQQSVKRTDDRWLKKANVVAGHAGSICGVGVSSAVTAG